MYSYLHYFQHLGYYVIIGLDFYSFY